MLPDQVDEEEEVPRSESGFAPRPEIELPESGVLGDYFNSFLSSLLNIITIRLYKYVDKDSHPTVHYDHVPCNYSQYIT